MFAALEPQAKSANVSDEAFGIAIEGCVDAATDAFQAELADFFRRIGRVKAAEALEVGMEAGRDHAAAVDRKLDRETLRALIQQDLNQELSELDKAIEALKRGAELQPSPPLPVST